MQLNSNLSYILIYLSATLHNKIYINILHMQATEGRNPEKERKKWNDAERESQKRYFKAREPWQEEEEVEQSTYFTTQTSWESKDFP